MQLIKTRKEVKTFLTRIYCSDCGDELVQTGRMRLLAPSTYEHKCACGNEYWCPEKYPMTELEEIISSD